MLMAGSRRLGHAPGQFRPHFAGRSSIAIKVAASLAVAPAIRKVTTFDTGRRAVRRSSRISYCCAVAITAQCMRMAFRWSAWPMARSSSADRTAGSYPRYLNHPPCPRTPPRSSPGRTPRLEFTYTPAYFVPTGTAPACISAGLSTSCILGRSVTNRLDSHDASRRARSRSPAGRDDARRRHRYGGHQQGGLPAPAAHGRAAHAGARVHHAAGDLPGREPDAAGTAVLLRGEQRHAAGRLRDLLALDGRAHRPQV